MMCILRRLSEKNFTVVPSGHVMVQKWNESIWTRHCPSCSKCVLYPRSPGLPASTSRHWNGWIWCWRAPTPWGFQVPWIEWEMIHRLTRMVHGCECLCHNVWEIATCHTSRGSRKKQNITKMAGLYAIASFLRLQTAPSACRLLTG